MAPADRAFALVLALALGSSVVLIGLLGTLLPRVGEVFAAAPFDLEGTVVALVLVLALLGIALGMTSLARQLVATATLIRRLVARRVAPSRRVREVAADLGLLERLDVVDDIRAFSFCYWFLRPRICLSTALVRRLDREELRAVLVHERYHLAHRDPLRLMLARYFAAGLYVVPVVAELVEDYAVHKELAADQEAVRTTGVRPLASALYKLLRDSDRLRLEMLAPVSALSVTEARIDQLVSRRPVQPHVTAPSVALSLGTLLGAAAIGHAQACLTTECTIWPPHFPEAALLAASAGLLFIAAIAGGAGQLRLVAAGATPRPPRRSPKGQ